MQVPPVLEYSAERQRRWNLRRVVGTIILATGSAVALQLWVEIAYRMMLYYGEDGGIPGMSHVGDGSFPGYYRQGAIGAVIALFGGLILWRRKTSYITAFVILLNVSGSFSFYLMHRWLFLVEYSEWIRMHGP